jgi:hypothetical protein
VTRALWLLSCLCVACAGTETGNPSFGGSLGYDAYSSAAARDRRRVIAPLYLSRIQPVYTKGGPRVFSVETTFLGLARAVQRCTAKGDGPCIDT